MNALGGIAGGRGGIRTPDTLSGTPVFKTGAINHSATLPLYLEYKKPASPPQPLSSGNASMHHESWLSDRATLPLRLHFVGGGEPLTALKSPRPTSERCVTTVFMAKRIKSGTEPQPGQAVSLRTLRRVPESVRRPPISLVLNNAPGVRSIPQETRDRVTEAATKFDYRPSFYARSLRKRQTFS